MHSLQSSSPVFGTIECLYLSWGEPPFWENESNLKIKKRITPPLIGETSQGLRNHF